MGAIPLSEGFATRVLAVLALPAAALTARRWTSSQQQRSRGVAGCVCTLTRAWRSDREAHQKLLQQSTKSKDTWLCVFQ